MTKTVLIKRAGALGDVILTTPIAQEFHRQGFDVHVETDCPAVYENHPFVRVLPPITAPDLTVDLNMAYEQNPKCHVIDAYAKYAFGHTDIDKTTSLWMSEEHSIKVPENTIAIHPGVTWRNRTWPEIYWEGLAKLLKDFGFNVIALGCGNDYQIGGATTVRGTTIHQVADIIDQCVAFIGNDSGLLHVAGTTSVPILGLFTCAKGEYRMPMHRDDWTAIYPDLPCYGCLHDLRPPVTYAGCRIGTFECVTKLAPNSVFLALLKLLSVLPQDQSGQLDDACRVLNGESHFRDLRRSNKLRVTTAP